MPSSTENPEIMRKKGDNRVIWIFYVFAILLSARCFGQPQTVLDTIPNYHIYAIPMPDLSDWGNDMFAANNYLKSSCIESGYWVQSYKSDSLKIARIFRIDSHSLNGKDIFFEPEGYLKRINHYKNGFLLSSTNYQNGLKIDSINYDDKGLNSMYMWYTNGNIKYIEYSGYVERRYENGALKIKVNFLQGVPNNESVYIDEYGIEYHIYFDHGRPKKVTRITKFDDKKTIRFKTLPKSIRLLFYSKLIN